MKYLIAHDLGTSGNKATMFTTDGAMVNSITHAYPTNFYNANWAEQNPLDWWDAICITTKQLMQGKDPHDVAAISFSGQMMGCVCIDKNGNLLRDAIIWADQRAQEEISEIEQKWDPRTFYEIVGHKISASYSLEKLMWIRNNQPDIFKQIYKMLLPKDYIIYRLTGNFVTDYSDASGTNAFDLKNLKWSSEIMDSIKMDMDILPDVQPSTYVAGGVLDSAAQQCGLLAGTPVVVGGGDGACAAVGAGSVSENVMYNYLGSSSWISYTSKEILLDPQMRTFTWAHIVPGLYLPCGTMQAAGNSLSFIKNTICGKQEEQARLQHKRVYALIDEAIEKSEIGANALLFLPYLIGERSPRWDPDARGAFVGLKMEHKQEDLLRATVEGIFFNLNIILKIFKEHADIQSINILGGLAKGAIERRMMADIYNVDICKLNYLEEATSIGAAVTAGVGVGALKSFDTVHDFVKVDEIIHPNAENSKKYEPIQRIFDQCYYALKPIYQELKNI